MDRNEADPKVNEADPKVNVPAAQVDEVDILEIEDDLDTGMHRVNVCVT